MPGRCRDTGRHSAPELPTRAASGPHETASAAGSAGDFVTEKGNPANAKGARMIRQTRKIDAEAFAYHCDVSNEFCSLWQGWNQWMWKTCAVTTP